MRSRSGTAAPSLLGALQDEARARTAREELRLLWRYDRWHAAPAFATAGTIALLTLAITATLSVVLSRLALGDSLAASYALWALGLAAGLVPPFVLRRWPSQRPITRRLEQLEASNPTRLVEIWLPRSAIGRASEALHRAGLITGNGALVAETQRLPDRPELSARMYVHQPRFRTTQDDIALRVHAVLQTAGVSARVGGHDVHGPPEGELV